MIRFLGIEIVYAICCRALYQAMLSFTCQHALASHTQCAKRARTLFQSWSTKIGPAERADTRTKAVSASYKPILSVLIIYMFCITTNSWRTYIVVPTMKKMGTLAANGDNQLTLYCMLKKSKNSCIVKQWL